MIRFLKYLLHLVLSPGKGWEDISHEGQGPKMIVNEGLYPLLGIASLSAFIVYFYNDEYGLAELLQHAIIIFVQYFISFFIASFLYSIYAVKYVDGAVNEKKNHTLISYSLALLSVITIIGNCLPMELSLVQFLPVYVALVIWKGCRYMAVKEEKTRQYMIFAVISIILPPILLGYLFNLIIP